MTVRDSIVTVIESCYMLLFVSQIEMELHVFSSFRRYLCICKRFRNVQLLSIHLIGNLKERKSHDINKCLLWQDQSFC